MGSAGDRAPDLRWFRATRPRRRSVANPDRDMISVWTADDAVDVVVKRSSAVDDAAPWTTGEGETDAET